MKYFKAINVMNRLSLIFMFANLMSIFFVLPFLRGYFYPWICLFCFLFYCMRENESKIKYVFLAVAFMPVFFLQNWKEIGVTSFVFAGSLYLISIYKEKPDFNLMLSIFKREYKILFVSALISVFLLGDDGINQYVAPYLIIHMITSTVVLRTIRFTQHNFDDKRINKVNAVYGIFAAVTSIIISVEQIRVLVGKGIYLVYLGILRVIYYLMAGIMAVFGKSIDNLMAAIKKGGGKWKESKFSPPEDPKSLYANFKGSLVGKVLDNPIVEIIGQVLIVAVAAYIIYRLTRRYWSDKLEAIESDQYEEEKEAIKIEKDKDKKGIFARLGDMLRPKTLEEQIRYHYFKLLGILRGKGVEINRTDTSLQVNEKSSVVYDRGILDEIRGIYIAVRYGGRRGSKYEAQRIGDLVKKGDK